jgi:hypothetical protein
VDIADEEIVHYKGEGIGVGVVALSPHFVPLIFHHTLQIRGGLRGTHDRKEALEGDQELYQLLLRCSSPSVHSLPSGPRVAEEKESGFPVSLRFKSAGAGEYTGGW